MPKNLYNFMAENKFNTFNNVASGILTGTHDSAAYASALRNKPPNIFWAGWFKGLALKRTGLVYGITDSSSLILFDNDLSYLVGVRHYDRSLRVVCAGMPCNGTLTLESIAAVLD